MTILERHVREARRDGAEVRVRADHELAEALSALGVQRLEPDAPLPTDEPVVRGDVLLGITVTDEASRRRAEKALMETCRRPYDGLGDRYLGRPISLQVTRLLTRLPVQPNQVTAVSFVLGITAGVLVATGRGALLPVAAALLFASWILDSVDGELARVRHIGSHAGMVADNVSDDIIDNVFTLCLGIGLGGIWLPIAVAATIGRSLAVALTYIEVARDGKPGDVMAFRWWFEAGESTEEVFADLTDPLTIVRSFGRRDTYVAVYATSLALGIPQIALGLAVLNAVGYFALASLHVIARRRAV